MSQAIADIMNRELTAAINEMDAMAEAQGRIGSGKTMAAVTAELVVRAPFEVEGRVMAPDYIFQALEDGRRPGKMPPVSEIEQWVDSKGLDISPWAIAKTIAAKGTKLYREGGRSGVITQPFGPKLVERLKTEIGQAVGQLAMTEITKDLSQWRSL